MTYAEHNTLPAYEALRVVDGKIAPASSPDVMLWGNADMAPPAIGTRIIARINNCGPAIVTGYFTQEGFLGVLCTLTSPPEWHVKQNKGNPKGHLFGPELRMPKDGE